MSQEERARVIEVIAETLPHLTDEELKAIVCMTLTRTTCDGTPITEL